MSVTLASGLEGVAHRWAKVAIQWPWGGQCLSGAGATHAHTCKPMHAFHNT